MTNHECEWAIIGCEYGLAEVQCTQSGCRKTLPIEQAEAMLNAAQVLSAKRALRIAELIEELGNAIDGEGGGKTTKVLRAYAEKREVLPPPTPDPDTFDIHSIGGIEP